MSARSLHDQILRLHEESLRLHKESLRLHEQSLERLEEALRLRQQEGNTQEDGAESTQSELSELSEVSEFRESCRLIPFAAIFSLETSKSPERRRICMLSDARA
jgi:hypothetical protein